MARSTDLIFKGGSIASGDTPAGANHNIRNIVIRSVTITDAGHEVTLNVLCDYDHPITQAPNFEPINLNTFATWIASGDVIQFNVIDESELGSGVDSAYLHSVTFSNDAERGIYVSQCKIAYDLPRSANRCIEQRILTFSRVLDQATNIEYLYEEDPMKIYDNTVVRVSSSDNSASFLSWKIEGDSSSGIHVNVRTATTGEEFLKISYSGASFDNNKVKTSALDDTAGYLTEKIYGEDGILVDEVDILDDQDEPTGDKALVVKPDPNSSNPFIRRDDLDDILESRLLENVDLGTVSANLNENINSNDGTLNVSVCHSYMNFELRKELRENDQVVQRATEASVFVTQSPNNYGASQYVRICVFKAKRNYMNTDWLVLVGCTDDIDVIAYLNEHEPGKYAGRVTGKLTTLYEEGNDHLFAEPADVHQIKSGEELYIGVITHGDSIGLMGHKVANAPINLYPRITAYKTGVVSGGFNPANIINKNIDIYSTSTAQGNKPYVMLKNYRVGE